LFRDTALICGRVKASVVKVELSKNRFRTQEAFVSHAHAALTPKARLRLALLIVEDGWKPPQAARLFMDSTVTVRKWAARLRTEGPAGMRDRSSRLRSCPHQTPDRVVRQIARLRWRHRLGPVQIRGQLGLAGSTVHAVLVRCRVNRLSHIDRVTGEPIRRYEHPYQAR